MKNVCCVCLLMTACFAYAETAVPTKSEAPVTQKSAMTAAPTNPDPVADPRAVVTLNHARFTVLTPRLIRMEWAADGKFEDHASFVFLNRRMPVPKFSMMLGQTSAAAKQVSIETSALKLTYTPGDGDGHFTADNLTVSLSLNGKDVVWHPGMEDSGNLMGTTRTLDGARGNKLGHGEMEPGLMSRDGWTVVDDSTRPLFDSTNFSFTNGEKSPWPWVLLRPAGERQDLYFFGYGHDYKGELGDYIRVAGRIPLPPRFAFGTWWSRYWAYSDQELDELVRGFHENDTPLDVLVIDMDWHINQRQLEAEGEVDQAGEGLGWTGYSWNKLLFPDPEQFLKNMHEQGLKATLNMHPASGVQPWETAYPAMAKAMGIDPTTKKYVPFDITNKKFAMNYMDLLHHPLEKQGIDFWWLDWQQEMKTSMPGVNPTWWLNYVHFTDQEREGKRPLLFHRWGGLGNHRYQIGFSGDTFSVWDSLAFQPWFTATAANVGYAYWSHDIGGHQPGAVDPQLFTRWIQFGAFSPILRTHTTKNPESERRIWAYPEPYADIMRQTFQLRYALQPYVYTEARRTYDTGVAFLRPLYYDWPEADEAYTNKNEYRFGDSMIVEPVTKPVEADTELASQSVWIPEGEWIEWPTGKHFTGPTTVERSFSIGQIPVYLRAGAIVPMQPKMEFTGQKPVDPLILNVVPMAAGQKSTYTVYEDSSSSEAYKHGVAAWTTVNAKQTGDDLEVEIEPVRGSYPGMPAQRGYELRLPGDWPPASVTVNGQPIRAGKGGWRYEGNTLTTVIPVPRTSVTANVTVRVHRAAGLVSQRASLDGFAGSMTRFRSVYDALNSAWPVLWSPDSLIDAMQMGDRLSYQPETAAKEIGRLKHVSSEAVAAIQQLADKANVPDDQLAKNLGGRFKSHEDAQTAISRYRMLVHRALVQAQDATGQSR
jgi:alpha-glucosidase (family GH31 glycosyl hydrolase)